MRVLVTGGAGFVGQHLAQRLSEQKDYTIVLTDIIEPSVPAKSKNKENVLGVQGDLSQDASRVVERAMQLAGGDLDAVVILHGIMSSKSEVDFDLGMQVNLNGTQKLLEALRRQAETSRAKPARVLFASSLAVFGPPYDGKVSELTKPLPQSSYGAEKAICEILVSEYSRRSFIDGLVLRFPTVSIRPGKPAPAASAFLSGIIREPLVGIESEVPIEDDDFESYLCSPATLITNICHALTLPRNVVAAARVVNLPGIVVSIGDMLRTLEELGGSDALKLVKRKADPAAEWILRSWPVHFQLDLATKLGFHSDESFHQMAKQHIDYMSQ